MLAIACRHIQLSLGDNFKTLFEETQYTERCLPPVPYTRLTQDEIEEKEQARKKKIETTRQFSEGLKNSLMKRVATRRIKPKEVEQEVVEPEPQGRLANNF